MIDLIVVPLVAALIILAINAYFGLHIIRRGVIFVDLAFAQIAALGSTIAFLLGAEVGDPRSYLFAFGFTLLGALLFSLTRVENGHVSQEAYIGISYVVASAAVILLSSFSAEGAEHVKETLTGSLIWATWPTVQNGVFALIASSTGGSRRHARRDVRAGPCRASGWNIFYLVRHVIILRGAGRSAPDLLDVVIPAVVAFLYGRFLPAWHCLVQAQSP
jgi:zinc/manganese transport system permease protein